MSFNTYISWAVRSYVTLPSPQIVPSHPPPSISVSLMGKLDIFNLSQDCSYCALSDSLSVVMGLERLHNSPRGHPYHVNGLLILPWTSFLTRHCVLRCRFWPFIWTLNSQHRALLSCPCCLCLLSASPPLGLACWLPHSLFTKWPLFPCRWQAPLWFRQQPRQRPLSPAVPSVFQQTVTKVHEPWEESQLPFSSHCWDDRKSEKAFHYPQQVSAPGYINTSNQGM